MRNDFTGELKSNMYSLVNVGAKENKKAKGFNKGVASSIRHKKLLMFYLVGKWRDTERKNLKVDCIELELMMFVRFKCLVMMIRDTYETMQLIVWLIFIKIREINKIG